MTKHLRFLFVMLLAMIWSAGWAAETVYKILSFPDDNQAKNKVSSYASSWTAKIGSDSWSIVNFNNNNWGGGITLDAEGKNMLLLQQLLTQMLLISQ